jgi:hypothetical protein
MVGLVVIAGREGKAMTMPVRRDPRTGGWFFRTTVKTPDGKKPRLYGTPGVPGPYQDLAATKIGAQEAEQRAIKGAFAEATGAATPPVEKEVPTFDEWFNGRFWLEWVVGGKNKPTEVRSKQIIYRIHLKDRLGDKRLNEIDVGEIARFRAELVQGGELSEKRHKRIDETMLYVHVAEAHHRELPEVVRLAAIGETDPDTRILRMLGARSSHVAAEAITETKRLPLRQLRSCERGDSNPQVTIV